MPSRRTFASTVLDRESIRQESLDVARRVRTNLFPWPGQFSPQLAEELLAAYAPRPCVVLDPFVGSGTSLVEAARLGFEARGSELNPAAVILSRVYRLVNLDPVRRTRALDELRDQVVDAIGPVHGPLFSGGSGGVRDRPALEAALARLWRDAAPGAVRDLAAALVVLCDFHRQHLDADEVHRKWLRLARTVVGLPESDGPVEVHHADARDLPVETGSVDVVLTSPPYINVHNYHQQFRRSVEALEWDVLAYARSEIGSNRQNRGNRFLTVVQYSLDMALALREMARAAKPGALLILVLGRESLVRGTRFFNGELVAEIAGTGIGLRIERRQERVFRNRFGGKIYEDILHFRSTGEPPDGSAAVAAARRVAGQVLSTARPFAPDKESDGIDDAMARLEAVAPSPLAPCSVSAEPAPRRPAPRRAATSRGRSPGTRSCPPAAARGFEPPSRDTRSGSPR